MLPKVRWLNILSLGRRGLRTKIIIWFFVPTTLILVAVALVNNYAYQDVTEDLVIERDMDLTRLSAGQLSTELEEYTDLLSGVSRTVERFGSVPDARQGALKQAAGNLVVFDGGVVILNTFGRVVAADPQPPGLLNQDWSSREYFRHMIRSSGPTFSNIHTTGSEEQEVIAVAVPISGAQSEFLGTVVGMFRLNPGAVSAFYGGILKLRIGQSSRTYVVDGVGRVIHHPDIKYIGGDFSTQQVVRQVLDGQVGALRTRDFDGGDIVAGFAPIPGTPWGLVTEESWSALTSDSRGDQRFLLLLLALGIAVPAVVVAIGLRRIMHPIEDLIGAAREVARGNFGYTITTRSSDEIGELSQQFNTMASALKESYAGLEKKVEERTHELQESEERFRALFEESRDAIVVGHRGKVTAANQAALDLFGITAEEAIGSEIEERFDNPGDRDRFGRELAEKGFVINFEARLRKEDGAVMDCLLTASRLRVDGDDPGEVQVIIRDITARKRAEEALRESETMLRQSEKMAVLGTLTAGVAHELNNPAAAVGSGAGQLEGAILQFGQSQSQLNQLDLTAVQQSELQRLTDQARLQAARPPELNALARSDREDELKNLLEARGILDAWKHAPALVNLNFDTAGLTTLADSFTSDQLPVVVGLLGATYAVYNLLTEIGQGAGRISENVRALKAYSYLDQAPVQAVDVHEGLDNTLLVLGHKLKSGISVRKEYAPHLPSIQANGSELNQVWTNIIDNAVDALEGQGEVTIRTRHDGEWVVIEIEDDGPGIPAEIQSRIFEPFFTTKPSGLGIGLGLDISHNIIVQKHQGDIRVLSEPGKTRFQVWLPVTPP